MYVASENQLLYPASSEYNAARILTELAQVVTNAGGRVKPLRKARLINRTILEIRRKYEADIARLESLRGNSARANALQSYRTKLAAMENVSTEPITVTHTSWIRFILDDYVYYYDISDNPFFDFHYSKTFVRNGEYSLDVYSDIDKKEWLCDCFLRYDCSDSDVREAAHLIFNMLVKTPPSHSYETKKSIQVPNTYNDGYHEEYAPIKGRTAKVDW